MNSSDYCFYFFLFFYSSQLDIVIDVEAFMFWVLLFFLKILCFDGVTQIAEILDTMNGTHIMDVQVLKEIEIRSLDKKEIISYPWLADQTEESHKSLVIVPVTKVGGMFPIGNEALAPELTITTNEKHKESNRYPDANVRIEEYALLCITTR